ncbi:hypothetical protein [Stenotrophobium rhamnosiphilum]|uniref:Uncharacterized protein n=1 Tax=Stenotrophobium rhamnosiphilum TaxID=2029166 RepID=A0A2T5MJC1_9GAMM|nr:hypothetical protein [Stenotrophobium rhamnosiphilum]PTU32664.1 hypothetical protein CJD38_00630 [Stenotrophobium rhamnosiphilum]
MKIKANTYLLLILGLSLLLSAYTVVLSLKGVEASDGLTVTWTFVFAALVACWARVDAATQKVHRTLDFSFYFLAIWPIALPYYLVKTRGIEGLVLFFGFSILYFSPFISGLITYVYFATE